MATVNISDRGYRAQGESAPVEIPEWFDPALAALLQRKKNRKRAGLHLFDLLIFHGLERLVKPKDWSYTRPVAWKELEGWMQQDCERIQATGFVPDLIVGIKSGGAFIANFMAKCLGVRDVRYLQVKYYSPLLGSTVLSFLTRSLRKAQLQVDAPIPVEGKRILLVDDQIYTGHTINTARDWLLKQGAAAIHTYCLISARETADYCYRTGRLNYVPWGDDP